MSHDMTEPTTPRRHQRHPREKATDEFSRLVIIFGYLWVVFELLSVHKSIVLSECHLNYPEHAFAIVNSLVFWQGPADAESPMGHRLETMAVRMLRTTPRAA